MLTTIGEWDIVRLSACMIYRMIHKHLPNSARKILILMFLKDNKDFLETIEAMCVTQNVYLAFGFNTCYNAESR